jgi:hypothetical protein
MKKFVLPFFVGLALISVIGNMLAFYRYSSSRPLITVNGEKITKKEFDDRVDYLYARPLLSSMILEVMVNQAAQQAGCVPPQSDVDSAMSEIERTTPNVLETARKTDPELTLFKVNLKTNLELRNLRLRGVTVSSDEVQSYYQAHKKTYELPKQTQTTLVVAGNSVDADAASRLLTNGVLPSIIAEQAGLGVVGVNVNLTHSLPRYVADAVFSMKPGDVKVLPVGSQYVVVKVTSVLADDIPPLSAIAKQVTIDASLAKAPTDSDILAKLRSSSHIVANVAKYNAAIPANPDATPGEDGGQ